MGNDIKTFGKINDTLKYLDKVRFEFGIFDEDANRVETIKVLNLDGTTSSQEMKLSDIMYLTERGTITIPSKPILRNTMRQIQYEFPSLTNKIVHNVIHENWTKKEIREELQLFNNRINYVLIPNAIQMIISSDNVISGILNAEEDQNYTFDLKKLQKFIKSEIFFSD